VTLRRFNRVHQLISALTPVLPVTNASQPLGITLTLTNRSRPWRHRNYVSPTLQALTNIPSALPVTSTQLRWIGLVSVLALLWKTLTLRSPFFLVPPLPAIAVPHTCVVHHRDILPYCEDFAAIPNSPLLLLSCDQERHKWNHVSGNIPSGLRAGEVWIFDPTSPTEPPRRVHLGVEDFRPLGISATNTTSGTRFFVVNQALAGARVEVFDLSRDTSEAKHTATLQHARIASPNSVAATSSTGFYLTNDLFFARRGSAHVAALAAELLTAAPGGSLVHVSLSTEMGVERAQVVSRLAAGNGVAVDTATNRVWAAASLKGVYEFHYDPADPARVGNARFLRAAVLVDNLVFAAGEVFASGFTSLWGFFESSRNPEAKRPGGLTAKVLPLLKMREDAVEVVKRKYDIANSALRREEWRWETVFVDDGAFFGAVSTGAILEGGRYVGVSLLERGVVVCDEKPVKGRTVVEPEEEVKDEL